MSSIDSFKPYGFMTDNFQHDAEKRQRPSNWKEPETYERWLDAMTKLIADAIWPRWNPSRSRGEGEWVGPSRETAWQLTEADLTLMTSLAHQHDLPPARPKPQPFSHGWWLVEEDYLLDADWTKRAEYLKWSRVTIDEFRSAFKAGGGPGLAGASPWLLKLRLQRPRPNQAAYWMGLPPPVVKYARSALSPSAISGHAFQGLLACLNVHLEYGQRMSNEEKQDLLNLAVDIGDRRVFAGVHYPSDNAMSWRVALEAIKHMNRTDDQLSEMHQFAVQAIKSSLVLQEMRQSGSKEHAACVRFVEGAF